MINNLDSGVFMAYRNAAQEIKAIRVEPTECTFSDPLVGRQCAWQNPEAKVTEFRAQSMTGLCFLSQVFPKIMFQPANLVT